MNDMRITPALEQIRNLSVAASSSVAELPSEGIDFGAVLKQAIDSVNDNQKKAMKLRSSFEAGDKTINLAEVMVASQKANVSFEAMLQVRNQLVNAYKDVMNMSM